MTVRSVLVSLDDTPAGSATLTTAIAVAQRFGVRLDVLHVVPDPLAAVPAIGDGMSAGMADRISAQAGADGGRRAQAARALFERVVDERGLPVLEPDAPGNGFALSWIERMGRHHKVLARLGRVHDLIVVGQPSDPSRPDRSMTIEALFDTGRPVLIAPPIVPETVGQTMAIAWNGSPECARALGGASNFLGYAEQVVVLTAESERTPARVIPDLERYLALHGVAFETRRLPHRGGGHLGGRPLLDACSEIGADLLVMGAHRSGRLRELVLGSATREVLQRAAIPVLMGH